MIAAGLLAKKAVEKGLTRSAVGQDIARARLPRCHRLLHKAGLLPYLDKLRFNVVGYGCTTCIGNSGPLPTDVSKAIEDHGLVAVSVLSGNRNFEGRINSDVRANYLMSPPLVVAYALAGSIDHDFDTEPSATTKPASRVFLQRHLADAGRGQPDRRRARIGAEMFRKEYATVTDGDDNWQGLKFPTGDVYQWEPDSTYIRKAPYFDGMHADARARRPTSSTRACSQCSATPSPPTTSRPPASIKANGPAGKYLAEHGVKPADFNTYGSRRGNHEVMVRGTFANVRLRNKLAPGTEGGVTRLLPEGTGMSIYDASVEYAERGTPLVILAGKEYGSGSLARLGRQGSAPARRPRRAGRKLRAHPPLQPGRHGHPAAAISTGRKRGIARPDRRRDLRRSRPSRDARRQIRQRPQHHR